MISIKRLLNADTGDDQTMLRVAQILLQGMGLHAVEGDPDDYSELRESMDRMAAALDPHLPAPEMMVQAGASLKTLEEYNRRTAKYLRIQSTEWQSMVKMLTTTIGEISTAGGESVTRMHDIERQLAAATQVEDVRVMKTKLSECLGQIRKEAERQRADTSRTVATLRQHLTLTATGPSAGGEPAPAADTVTGLQPRAEAVEFITQACQLETPAYAVVFAMDRLQTINQTFGYDVGDRMLSYFSGYLRRNLPASDRIFRWTGPALVAMVTRSNRIETIREEIGRLMEHKLEHTVRTSTRSILIPVTARWTIFPMMASSRLVIHKIDSFASLQPAHG